MGSAYEHLLVLIMSTGWSRLLSESPSQQRVLNCFPVDLPGCASETRMHAIAQELLEDAMQRMTALRRSDGSGGTAFPLSDQPSGQGRGGVLVLEAGMGLGKTRVLEELAARARGAGLLVLSGRGDAARTGQVSSGFVLRQSNADRCSLVAFAPVAGAAHGMHARRGGILQGATADSDA